MPCPFGAYILARRRQTINKHVFLFAGVTRDLRKKSPDGQVLSSPEVICRQEAVSLSALQPYCHRHNCRVAPRARPTLARGLRSVALEASGPCVDHLSGSISVQLSNIVIGMGCDQLLHNNWFEKASWGHSWKRAHSE